jgi:hypothetical protein
MPTGNSATRDYLLKQSGPMGPGMGQLATAIAPVTATAAPNVNADFLGQMWIKTDTGKVYIAVAVGSGTPANDWAILN